MGAVQSHGRSGVQYGRRVCSGTFAVVQQQLQGHGQPWQWPDCQCSVLGIAVNTLCLIFYVSIQALCLMRVPCVELQGQPVAGAVLLPPIGPW